VAHTRGLNTLQIGFSPSHPKENPHSTHSLPALIT
jgi:hypothetical protein